MEEEKEVKDLSKQETNKESKITENKKSFKKTPIWKILLVWALIISAIVFGSIKASEKRFKVNYISVDTTATHIVLNVEINSIKNMTADIYPEDFSAQDKSLPIQAKYLKTSKNAGNIYNTSIQLNEDNIIFVYFDRIDFIDIKTIKFYYKGNELIFGKNITIKK